MNTAQKVRLHKEKRPELYCSDKRCLWRVVRVSGEFTPCRKHMKAEAPTPATEVTK